MKIMKKQCVKKSAAAVLVSLLMLSLVSCSKDEQSRADVSRKSIKEEIAAIDGVISIEAIENNQSDWLPENHFRRA